MTRTGDERIMTDTIGIDISKDHLDTHRLSNGNKARFKNDRIGLKSLKAWIGPQHCRIIYEPTGRYHRDLEVHLSKVGHALVKVNPKRARRFAEAVGQSAKTDQIDAALLARMGAILDLEVSQLRDENMNDYRELQVARTAIIKDQTACQNRLSSARNKLVKAQLKANLRRIAKQLTQLDAELKRRICENATLARQFQILLSIPGIGPVAAIAIIVEMPEIGTLTPKQATALAGLAPFVRKSGKWTGKAKIGGGRAGLRRALYMPALVAARRNPQLSSCYKTMRSQGKVAKVALVAIMRKLLILANTLISENREWVEIRP
jgi:transposase